MQIAKTTYERHTWINNKTLEGTSWIERVNKVFGITVSREVVDAEKVPAKVVAEIIRTGTTTWNSRLDSKYQPVAA